MTVDAETFRVGAIECRRFIHGRGRGDPAWMFPNVPRHALADRMSPYLDRDGRFEFVYSSLIVTAGTEIVLLDTSSPPPTASEPSSIERALGAIGVSPSDIGAVVITHGHLDHVGGLSRSGAPVFTRARHIVSRDEIDYWTSGDRDGGDVAALLGPVVDAGLVDTVDIDRTDIDVIDGGQEIVPGLRVLPTPGHTPGHLAVEITSEGETAIYVGDVLAHEVNVREPGWNHFSDLQPTAAAASRRRLVERAARDRALVVGSHPVTVGRVAPDPSGGFVHQRGNLGAAVDWIR